MSPCHTAQHHYIFLSMAGTLPCPSVPFSCNSFSVYICFCFLSFCLTLSARVLLSTPSSRPSMCLSKQFETEAVSFSILYLLQQPSKCYPCDLGCFTSMPIYFHSSLGTTLFSPAILQPQLNSESELFFHSIALCATFIYFLSFFPFFLLTDSVDFLSWL